MQYPIGQYVIARGTGCGVHAGVLEEAEQDAQGTLTIRLSTSRRLWRWWAKEGVSLSGVAVYGLAKKAEIRLGAILPTAILAGICELLPTSPEARRSIEEVMP